MLGDLPLRTGNLSVGRIRAAVCGRPLPDGAVERTQLPCWRAAGFDQVEDYVAWCATEPADGVDGYEHHRENAAAARAAGLGWVPYLWAHAAPSSVRSSADWIPARCREHGEAGPLPSLYAPSTWTLVERFWRRAGAELAGLPDAVAVGFPSDYGEVGHGCGMADWLLVPNGESAHHHLGLWCGEDEARAVLPAEPAALSRAYRDNVTRWAARLLDLAADCFPGVPLELKLGHGSEALAHGCDWSALVRVAAERGVLVRSTHSALLPVFTRRLASLCRTHGARFATEAPRELETPVLRRRVLVDLAEGTTSWFEFPEQQEVVVRELGVVAECAGRGPAARAVAALYPRRALDREPGLGTAEALSLAHDALAAVCDFAVLDETQAEAGALADLSALVLLDPAPDLDVLDWVAAGGVLVQAHGGASPRYAGGVACAGAVRVEPGLQEHRLLVGAGWNARDDGAEAWGHGVPLPVRWTEARARLLVPRQAGEGEFAVELFADRACRVRLWADGSVVTEASVRGVARIECELPPAGGPLLAVDLETDPASPRGGDPRPLGVLVRAVEVGAVGAPRGEPDRSPRVYCEPGGPGVERVGAGLVLRGDGSPLSALAWLRTWLDGRLPVPAPALERDPEERDSCARIGGRTLRLSLSGP